MKRILYLTILFILPSILSFGQTTVYSQNFNANSSLPFSSSGVTWSQTSTLASLSSASPSSYTGGGASAGNNLLFSNTTNGVAQQIAATGISTVGYTSIKVQFGATRTSGLPGFPTMTLEWSANGTTWTNIVYGTLSSSPTWALTSQVALPAAANGVSNLRFRFSYTSSGSTAARQAYILRIDDFKVIGTVGGPITYYSKATGDLNELTSWGVNTDGSGTSPTNFVTDNQTFIIANNANPTINSDWTVSGTGSKVIVDAGVNFNIPNGLKYSGPIDVRANGTLSFDNTPASSFPTFGTLATNSTLVLKNYVDPTIVLPVGTYSNITVENGYPGINGDVTINGVLNFIGGDEIPEPALIIAGNALSLNGTLTGGGYLVGNGSIDGVIEYTTSSLLIGGSGDFGVLSLNPGYESLYQLTIDRASSGVVSLGSSVLLSSQLNLTNGTLVLDEQLLTLDNASINRTNGSIRGDGNANITLSGSGNAGTLVMDQSTTSSSTLNSLAINRELTLGSNLTIDNDLTLESGSYNFTVGSNTLTLNGPTVSISTGASFLTTSSSNLIFGPNSASVTIPPIANVNNLTVNNSNGVTTASNVIIAGTLSLLSGNLSIGSNTLTLNGAVSLAAGSSMVSDVNGTITYNQSSAGQQVVTGTYGNLQFSDQNKILTSSTITILGTFDPGTATGHTIGASTIIYAGTGAQTIAGFNYQNLTVSGSSRSITLSGVINIAGRFIPNNNIFPVNTSTVTFNGSGDQGVPSGTNISYYKLATSGGGTKTVGSTNLTVTNNLTIGSNTILNSVGYNINVGGNWVNSGSFTASTGRVAFTGGTQTISGTNSNFYDLTKSGSGSLVLNSAQSLTNTLTVSAGTFNSNGNLTLVSTATGTARIATIPSGASISGSITMQRYIPARRSFRFMASPVQGATIGMWRNMGTNTPGVGTHITGTGGATNNFDATITNSASAFTYNEVLTGTTTGAWTSVTNGNTQSLNNHVGYRILIRGDRTVNLNEAAPPPTTTTLSVKGVPYTGDQPVTLSYTSSLAVADRGWNLIGNPYPSAIDFNLLSTADKNLVSNSFQTWDPTSGLKGAYYYYNNGVGNPVRSNPSVIASSQAFLVKATAAGTLTFKETMKTSGTNAVGFREVTENLLRIKMSNGQVEDQAVVRFDDAAVLGFDQLDSYKFPNLDANLSSEAIPGSNFAINSLPYPTKELAISLITKSTEPGNYVLEFSELASLSTIGAIYLEDKLLNTKIDLFKTSTYTFKLSAEVTDEKRFRLVFYSSNSQISDKANKMHIYPNPTDGTSVDIVVPASTAPTAKVSIFNTLGELVFEQEVHTIQIGDNSVVPLQNLSTLSKGVYVVKCVTSDNKYIDRLVIQ